MLVFRLPEYRSFYFDILMSCTCRILLNNCLHEIRYVNYTRESSKSYGDSAINYMQKKE
jgi:hypothetical protein